MRGQCLLLNLYNCIIYSLHLFTITKTHAVSLNDFRNHVTEKLGLLGANAPVRHGEHKPHYHLWSRTYFWCWPWISPLFLNDKCTIAATSWNSQTIQTDQCQQRQLQQKQIITVDLQADLSKIRCLPLNFGFRPRLVLRLIGLISHSIIVFT